MEDWRYFEFAKGNRLPARRDGDAGVPQVWSRHGWVADPRGWNKFARPISEAEFMALCSECGAKMNDWRYFEFNNGIPLPARRNGEFGMPQVWSMGKWGNYVNPRGWAEHSDRIDEIEFTALCKERGANMDDPVVKTKSQANAE